jgi:hypothetical protein
MKLVYPEFLWAFFLLAIPIIVHLFNFKRYKTLHFSSLTFLRSVTQQTRSTQKLKHIVTLLLRILAISALILAFAQPIIPGKSNSGGSESTLAIYIDNSFSMQARGNTGSLLNEAKETARKVIESVPLGTNLMLLTNALDAAELRLISTSELNDQLDKIDFYPASATIPNVLNAVTTKLEGEFNRPNTQVMLLSDFQQGSLLFHEKLEDTTTRILPVQLIPQNTSNLFIDSVWFDQPLRKINVNNTLHVRVENAGNQDLNNVSLNLKVNEYSRQTLVDLPARKSVEVTFNYTDKSTGWKRAMVEIEDDQVFFDDAFYFSYEVKERMNVIVLTEDGAKPYATKVFETEPFFHVQELEVNQFKGELLDESDVLVVNGLTAIPSGIVQLCLDFVEADKSLIIIPSKNSDITSYNNFFSRLQLPILKNLSSNSLRLNKINYADPFFHGVFDKQPDNIQLPKVANYYRSTSTSKTNVIPLVLFENDEHLFVKSGANKKVFAFYMGTDDRFGKVHEHILFSTVLLRAAELSQTSGKMWLTLGKDEAISISRPKGFQGALKMKNDQLEFIPPALSVGGRDVIMPGKNELGVSLNAGHFAIMANNDVLSYLTTNYDREESMLAYYSKAEIEEQLISSGFSSVQAQTLTTVAEKEQFKLDKPTEYWRILLILGGLFLLMEMLVTAFWRV